jgi:hypothetical protein
MIGWGYMGWGRKEYVESYDEETSWGKNHREDRENEKRIIFK